MRSKAGAFLELRVWERRQARFIHPRPGGGGGMGMRYTLEDPPPGTPMAGQVPP